MVKHKPVKSVLEDKMQKTRSGQYREISIQWKIYTVKEQNSQFLRRAPTFPISWLYYSLTYNSVEYIYLLGLNSNDRNKFKKGKLSKQIWPSDRVSLVAGTPFLADNLEWSEKYISEGYDALAAVSSAANLS